MSQTGRVVTANPHRKSTLPSRIFVDVLSLCVLGLAYFVFKTAYNQNVFEISFKGEKSDYPPKFNQKQACYK